jgi:low-density lipoprotein receptor-related protein 1 (alpha-2-macroglobulin receptor)
LLTSNIQPFGLVVYHDSKQIKPINYSNPCNEKKCSHICLLTSNSTYECKCPYFMKLNENNTCFDIETFILISNENDIRGFDYNEIIVNKRSLNIMPPFSRNDIDNITSFDYDPIDKFIYYLDGSNGYIARFNLLNTSNYEKIIQSGLSNSVSLKIDWISKNLYFLTYDSSKSRIHMSKLNGQYRTTILNNPFIKAPNSLALHQSLGYIFILDVTNDYSKLMRSNMDGSNELILIDSFQDLNFTKPRCKLS